MMPWIYLITDDKQRVTSELMENSTRHYEKNWISNKKIREKKTWNSSL